MKISDLLSETMATNDRLSVASLSTIEKYYPKLKGESKYWLQNVESAYKYVFDFIATRKNPRILDVGSGVGTDSLAFAMQGASMRGIDVTPEYLECAKERLGLVRSMDLDAQFMYSNLVDYQTDRPFDAIWLNQAFHHLEPRAEIVVKLSNLVNQGGYIFISDTNALNPLVQLMLFKCRGFETIREYEDPNGIKRKYGRERVTTVNRIIGMFAKCGFRSRDHRYYKVFPNSEKFANLENMSRKLKLPNMCYANFSLSLVKE